MKTAAVVLSASPPRWKLTAERTELEHSSYAASCTQRAQQGRMLGPASGVPRWQAACRAWHAALRSAQTAKKHRRREPAGQRRSPRGISGLGAATASGSPVGCAALCCAPLRCSRHLAALPGGIHAGGRRGQQFGRTFTLRPSAITSHTVRTASPSDITWGQEAAKPDSQCS